jgi:hypothetical protein
MYRFSSRSYNNLQGVNPRLVAVATLALARSDVDFLVIEGLRTPERQAELVAAGASRTMKSKHLTGDAIDVAAWVGGAIRWDWPLYARIAAAFKSAAADLGVTLTWGGDWTTLMDGPHFELRTP